MDSVIFLGLETECLWPQNLPEARLIEEKYRHLTIAFFGKKEKEPLLEILKSLPLPSFPLAGKFTEPLFLPEKNPRVVAWKVELSDIHYIQKIHDYLEEHALFEKRSFLPHITLGRAPFKQHLWKKAFQLGVVRFSKLSLFESQSHLTYPSLWSIDLPLAWEEMDHTADVAFKIRGKTWQEKYQFALYALAEKGRFTLPQTLRSIQNFEECVFHLNQFLSEMDCQEGAPFKAISYHSQEKEDYWEMIVDV